MIYIYAIKLDNSLNKELFISLMEYVTEERQIRIAKFVNYIDAQRCLFGELLARYGIMKIFKLRNEDITFAINNYGKPYILRYPNMHFNISHSGNWVVCAINTELVGIDVELIKPIDLNIANRFFTKKEYLSILNEEGYNRKEYFYKLWTLKESYIKAIGMGLTLPLNSFNICINDNCISFTSIFDHRSYSFIQFLIDKSHIVALCALGNCNNHQLHMISISELEAGFTK